MVVWGDMYSTLGRYDRVLLLQGIKKCWGVLIWVELQYSMEESGLDFVLHVFFSL